MSKQNNLLQKRLLPLLLPILLFIGLAFPAYAQGPDQELPVINWQELKTDHFLIVYAENIEGLPPEECACGLNEAQFYAGFIDEIYGDLVAVFEVELDTPINLRLFPTEETYFEVNPLAERIPGLIAHALNDRAEIAIALPRTRPLSEDDIVNNMRHELTHFFASLLSDGKLNTGFHEGIAQYLEKPNDRTGFDPALLEQAYQQSRLLTWAEMDKAQNIFRDPQVAYPQALSMASFLIDRYGFVKFVDFIKANAKEPGYRSALQVVYGKSADALETEWQEYLPDYFAGRWQINTIYAYDLSRVAQLVENGAYSAAEAELTEIVTLLESTDQAEVLAQAESLLARAHQGQAAGALADEARQALLNNDYQLAIDKGNAAINAFEELGFRNRIQELQTYVHRAELGQDALVRLNQGEQLLNSLRFFEAERELHEATALLQTLGNQDAARRGADLLALSTYRQQVFAFAMLMVGALLLLINGVRRFFHRFTAHPLEVEFT